MYPEIVTLCHSAQTLDNQLSILGAFDRITVEDIPSKFPPFTLACRVRFDSSEAGDHVLKVGIVDTDGRRKALMTVGIHLSSESFHPTASLLLTFPISGIDIECDGEYAIDLTLDSNEPLRTPFYVSKK